MGSLNNCRGKDNVWSWFRAWQNRNRDNGDKVISQHKRAKHEDAMTGIMT